MQDDDMQLTWVRINAGEVEGGREGERAIKTFQNAEFFLWSVQVIMGGWCEPSLPAPPNFAPRGC